MATIERARSTTSSPIPVSRPSSTSRPAAAELGEHLVGDDTRRDHDGQAGRLPHGPDQLDESRGAVVEKDGILPHRQVEEVHAGRGKVSADGDDLRGALAVAGTPGIADAVVAERARIAAERREVDEAVEEDTVAEPARALLAGGGEELLGGLVVGGEQSRQLGLAEDAVVERVRAQLTDLGGWGAHGSPSVS
jgi:hypothetical protein